MIRAEGLDPQSLLGVVLTHEHSDHSRGVMQLSALFGLPIYASAGTFRALGSPPSLDWRRLEGGKITSIGSIDVVPVQIPHDAAEPFIYRFESDHSSAAIATDFGSATDALNEAFRDLDVLVLEANHDESWLWKGGYPWSLKKRVASDHGHISNDTAGRILARLGTRAPREVWLAHISKQNNAPEHALRVVGSALKRAGLGYVQLMAAEPDRPSLRWSSAGIARQLTLSF
jgi:phosphoribosyl 1,2-cyclic phosphodiesterase